MLLPRKWCYKNNKKNISRFSDKFIEDNYNKEDIINLESKFGEIFLVRTDGFNKSGHVLKGSRTIIIVTYK